MPVPVNPIFRQDGERKTSRFPRADRTNLVRTTVFRQGGADPRTPANGNHAGESALPRLM